MMWLSKSCLFRLEQDLCTIIVYVQCPKYSIWSNEKARKTNLKIRTIREKAVKLEISFSQSSYRLYRHIWGSVAFRIKSPSFSTLRQAWNGSWSSEPLMTMLGKSSKWTSSGSNIPFRVTIICFGCSSTGNDLKRIFFRSKIQKLKNYLINAATSSAVFHLANWPRRFWPAQTEVWIIFKKSWPVRGLKMKIAPLIGFVVKLPSKVLWIVTR